MAELPFVAYWRGEPQAHERGPDCRHYATHWHDADGRTHWSLLPHVEARREALESAPSLAPHEEAELGRIRAMESGAALGAALGRAVAGSIDAGRMADDPPPPRRPWDAATPAGPEDRPLSLAERRVLGPYLRRLADALGLRDWHLELDHAQPEREAALATVEKVYGRRLAHVAVRGRIALESADSVRHALTHELAHLPFEPIFHLLDEAVAPALGLEAGRQHREAYRLLLEEAIDHLAVALAPHMPAFPGWRA